MFARAGYQQATVRDIVERAGVHVGAINYYFAGKAGLYREVLRHAHRRTIKQFRAAAEGPDPEQRLIRFIRTLLCHILQDDVAADWEGAVLCNEFLELHLTGKHALFRRFIRPRREILTAIIRDLIGPDADEEAVTRHVVSVVGQCAFYFLGRGGVEAAYGRPLGESDLEPLTRHIATVTLGGIRMEAVDGWPGEPAQESRESTQGRAP